ncbi:MAG: hypothetical protein KME46_34590 [Brasilonema angustatum HA4187-MV1]|jgi:hypothetical protein|nr:hypothetical protein [Brasilonema angustatum HA4187-MV1]
MFVASGTQCNVDAWRASVQGSDRKRLGLLHYALRARCANARIDGVPLHTPDTSVGKPSYVLRTR